MKTYWDLSERERSELTEEQVKCFEIAELMEKGVLRAPEWPEIAELPEVPAPSTWLTLSGTSLLLPDTPAARKALEELVTLGAARKDHDWRIQIDKADALSSGDIVTASAYTANAYHAARAKLSERAATSSSNEAAEREFVRQTKAQADALQGLWTDYRARRAERARMEKIRDTWDEYVTTAGSPVVAASFFRKAFTRDEIKRAVAWFNLPIPALPDATDGDRAESQFTPPEEPSLF